MQEVEVIQFQKKKRDEMTFGYLPEYVLPDLVPDMSGSARICHETEVMNLMMQMDDGFVGMRRNIIDKTEAVRQLIMYMMITKVVDGKTKYAVYQRADGSDPQLAGSYSYGFGGHVEAGDLGAHLVGVDGHPNNMVPVLDCPSSYMSTMNSGLRELAEEVQLLLPEHSPRPLNPQEQGNEIMQFLKITSLQAVMAQQPLDEYREGAIFQGEKYVILRDEKDGLRGLLVYTEPTPVDVVYRDVFKCEPVTCKIDRVDASLLPCGFLSDYKPEQKGFVGNTHIAVLAVLAVPSDFEFEVKEEKYTTVGWMAIEDMRAIPERFEAWSKILLDHLDDIAIVAEESLDPVESVSLEAQAQQQELQPV